MNRQIVSSTRMSSVGWESNTLEIQFKNVKIYQYYNVTQAEYQAFITSSSLGSALSKLDKTHRYSPV